MEKWEQISKQEQQQKEFDSISKVEGKELIERLKKNNPQYEDWTATYKKLKQKREQQTYTYTRTTSYDLPSLEDFEYSNYWRIEAYKAAKNYIALAIPRWDSECRVTVQGLYQPYNVKYLGGFMYSVKSYCEFDCNKNYNNPSNFWVEIYYQGSNTWSGEIVKQRFVD